jgi:hypothetical protein
MKISQYSQKTVFCGKDVQKRKIKNKNFIKTTQIEFLAHLPQKLLASFCKILLAPKLCHELFPQQFFFFLLNIVFETLSHSRQKVLCTLIPVSG